MAELAKRRAELPELQTLATGIITEQQQEITQMRDWYEQWFGTTVPTAPPEEEGNAAAPAGEHGGHGQTTGNSEADALRRAENFDLEFVRSMIRHHEGAITMAENVLPEAEHQEIKTLARAIITSQITEIDQMRELETLLSDN